MHDGQLKILIIGSSELGKTCLLKRYCYNSFSDDSPETIGFDIDSKIVNIDGFHINLKIFDTCGAERFQNFLELVYHDKDGYIIVCDCTSENSIKETKYWFERIKLLDIKDEVIIAVFGNKCELDRKVPKNYAKSIALENGLHYFEVSAKDGKGVEEAFYYVASLAYHLKLKKELEEEKKTI